MAIKTSEFNISALFIYTCGAVIVIEDLGTGKQNFLMGRVNLLCLRILWIHFVVNVLFINLSL